MIKWFSAPIVFIAAIVLSTASASAAVPAWRIDSLSNTTAAPESTIKYRVQVTNIGSAAASGTTVVLISLPPGLTGSSAEGSAFTCTAGDGVSPVVGASAIKCTATATVGVNKAKKLTVVVSVAAAIGEILTTSLQVSGGGALSTATTVDPTKITSTPPGFGIDAFDQQTTDVSGNTYADAGVHADGSVTSIDFNTLANPEQPLLPEGILWPAEPTKDVVVDLPSGFAGNPTSIAKCTAGQLASGTVLPRSLCSPESQLGTVIVRMNAGGGTDVFGPIPLFNMLPPPGVPARFGFNVAGTVITMDAKLRSGSDYGIAVDVSNISEGLTVAGTNVSFWGVPSASGHDSQRACPGVDAPWQGGPTCPSVAAPVAFLRNPTSCTEAGVGLTTAMHIDSWEHPAVFDSDGSPNLGDPNWKSATSTSHEAPGYPYPPSEWGEEVGIEGCEEVPFEPSLTLQPTTNRAESPTGLDVDLTMPQQCWDPNEESSTCQADVKDTVVTQPVGTRINPAAADGLTGCSEAQIGLIGTGFGAPNPIHFSTADPACPDSSKIGTVEIITPLQEEPLHGAIYQARQDENPFHSTLAFYAVAKGQGLMIKLPAEVMTDPDTGQVTTIFRDNPQLPFSHYRLHFFGGSHAPLITPPTCGTFTTRSTFTGWANPGEPIATEDSFAITSGPNGTPCATSEAARPFAPSFEAGTVNPLAGAFSPFVLKVSREDGMQELSGLETTLPQGLLGRLAGTPYCPEAAIAAAKAARGLGEQAAPSCPAASQIGVTDATAGAGPAPLHNPGKVYLAGPYEGAPLSVVIVTPALAGPLDLGTVVVRAALHLDPTTTQIHIVSDPLPTILREGGDGFPLDLREVRVHIDRDQFTLNPTSCDPMSIEGRIASAQGAGAAVASRFQVGNCARLAFKPKLSFRFKGSHTRTGHPALRATLTMPPGGANLARAAVSLPPTELLDNAHIGTVCTRVVYGAGNGGGEACPARSLLGHARVFSPLLDRPLEGSVYLRSNGGEHLLPDLVVSLSGQLHIDVVGRIDATRAGALRTTFENAPDAPFSKFVLTMSGGKKGLIQNKTNICNSSHRATALFDGQNGKTHDVHPKVRVDCGRRHSRANPSR